MTLVTITFLSIYMQGAGVWVFESGTGNGVCLDETVFSRKEALCSNDENEEQENLHVILVSISGRSLILMIFAILVKVLICKKTNMNVETHDEEMMKNEEVQEIERKPFGFDEDYAYNDPGLQRRIKIRPGVAVYQYENDDDDEEEYKDCKE